MIIRTLPGLNISECAAKHKNVYDSDTLIPEMVELTSEEVEDVSLIPKSLLMNIAKELKFFYAHDYHHLLTNVNWMLYGCPVDLHVLMKYDNYMKHLRDNKRNDILELYSDDEIENMILDRGVDWTYVEPNTNICKEIRSRGIYLDIGEKKRSIREGLNEQLT